MIFEMIADGRPSKFWPDPQCMYSAAEAAPYSWTVTQSVNQVTDLCTMIIAIVFMWKLKQQSKVRTFTLSIPLVLLNTYMTMVNG
jgi:hypothetical protein